MRVNVMQIVIGALGTVPKGWVKELEELKIGGRIDTVQTTAWLKSLRILRKVLETWKDLLLLGLP